MRALEQRLDCKIVREVAACTAPAVSTPSLREDVPTPLKTFRSDKIPDGNKVQMELNDSNRGSGFAVAHGVMIELFPDPAEGFTCESSRGREPLRVTSTAPAGRTGDTAYRQSVVIRRAEQMGEDQERAHKRARRKSPEYLETGHSDRRRADRDSVPGELVRTNHPCAMANGAVFFGLMKNRALRRGVVLPSAEARRTTSPLTVAMKTLGMRALFDVARIVVTFNFPGILATEHYVGYE